MFFFIRVLQNFHSGNKENKVHWMSWTNFFFTLELNDNEKHLIVSYYDRMIRIFVAIINEESDGKVTGRFTLKNSFSTNEQINVIHSRRLIQKNYELIVSQPGGAFVRFNPSEEPSAFFLSRENVDKKIDWFAFFSQFGFHRQTHTVKDQRIRLKPLRLIDFQMKIFTLQFVKVERRRNQ